jgi:hypothetical protein
MIGKGMWLGAVAVTMMAAVLVAASAEAKTKIHLGIGTPGYYYDPYYDPPAYYDDDYSYGYVTSYRRYRISCGEAKEMLRDRGYYRVRTRDCEGRSYSFLATKRGVPFIVRVSARSGEIISRDPL